MNRFLGVARAGRAVDRSIFAGRRAARAGCSVRDIDAAASGSLAESGAVSSMLGYDDGLEGGAFPMASSVSVNDEIMGAGDADRVLHAGDLVTIDLAASVDGWHADAAVSFCIGCPETSAEASRRPQLVAASRAVTRAGVDAIGRSESWPAAVDSMHGRAAGLGVVILPGFWGHGLGRSMHELPRLPMHRGDLRQAGTDSQKIKPGMILAIEPVVAWADTESVRDGWLESTSNGGDACFTEVTVAVGENRVLVLAGMGGDQGSVL